MEEMNKMLELGEKCTKPFHHSKPMKFLCISESCAKNALCSLCLSEGHVGHQIALFKGKTKYSLREEYQNQSKWMPKMALFLTNSNERLSKVNVENQNCMNRLKKISRNLQEMHREYQRQAEEVNIETQTGIAQISAVLDQIENTFIYECDMSDANNNNNVNINNPMVDQETIFPQSYFANLLLKNQRVCSELTSFKICLRELIEVNQHLDSIRPRSNVFNQPNILSNILDYLSLEQVKGLLYINKEFQHALATTNLISRKVLASYFHVSTPSQIYKGFLQLQKEAKQLFVKLLNKKLNIPITYYTEEISQTGREFCVKKMGFLAKDIIFVEEARIIQRDLKLSEKHINLNTKIQSLDEIALREKLGIEYDCLDYGIISEISGLDSNDNGLLLLYIFTSLTSFTLDHPFVQTSNVNNLNNTNVNNNQNSEDNQNNENNENEKDNENENNEDNEDNNNDIFLTVKSIYVNNSTDNLHSRHINEIPLQNRPFRYIGIVAKYTGGTRLTTVKFGDFKLTIKGAKINAEVFKMEGAQIL